MDYGQRSPALAVEANGHTQGRSLLHRDDPWAHEKQSGRPDRRSQPMFVSFSSIPLQEEVVLLPRKVQASSSENSALVFSNLNPFRLGEYDCSRTILLLKLVEIQRIPIISVRRIISRSKIWLLSPVWVFP